MEKKTPLYDRHVALGGKIVPFAGYLLPVQYTGVIEEHLAVRNEAGLFDVSHMGEFIVEGPRALENLNYILANDFTSMTDGRVRYTPICNEGGGVVDDLLVYRLSAEKYLLVPNAANRAKDFAFIKAHLLGGVTLTDISDSVAQIALQGPCAKKILLELTDEALLPEKYYTFTPEARVAGVKCLLSQTGYTGEHGYELYCAAEDAARLWDALLESAGEKLTLCGLGARDTLRLEASMPLYGHEMDEAVSPLETGLDFAVKMAKSDFVGKRALESRGAPRITRVGLKMTGRGIARENCDVFLPNGDKIGHTTSGTHCPYLGGAYAMALIDVEHSAIGTKLCVNVRGRLIEAEVVEMPFYKRA
ncbi:MAG: glycine cleavage system aminomethyltransferase GcvT [Oscillospiraceae bacterium]|jgi:aminomethyltransferase|nr:glycine cleavage system aminomethyltransferase GcvT [Oscillospiraceae bacterium]